MFEIVLYLCVGLIEIPCRPELAEVRQTSNELASTIDQCQVRSLEHQDWLRFQMTAEQNRRFSFATECVPEEGQD